MNHQPTIRTQISLTPDIKKAIEAKKRLTGESLSAYLRKAALMRLLAEDKEKKELELLAKSFVGAGRRNWAKNYPYWKNKRAIQKWVRQLREEWE